MAPPVVAAPAKKGTEPGITSPAVAAHHSRSAKFLNCSESLVDYKISFRNRVFNNNFDISLYKVKKDNLLMIQYEKRK